jgi:hypothetical protein
LEDFSGSKELWTIFDNPRIKTLLSPRDFWMTIWSKQGANKQLWGRPEAWTAACWIGKRDSSVPLRYYADKRWRYSDK